MQTSLSIVVLLGILALIAQNLLVLRTVTRPVGSSISTHDTIVPIGEKGLRDYRTLYERYQVQNTIRKNTRKIQTCYLQFLEKAPAKTDGELAVEWVVFRDGTVHSFDVINNELADDHLANCIRREMESWKFPPLPSQDQLYTAYHFTFHKES